MCPPSSGCSSVTSLDTSVRPREALGGNEWIVASVQHEVRHAHVAKQRLGRRARPVIDRVAEAVHGRGVQVVELVEVARASQHVDVDRVTEALRLVARLVLQRGEEHLRVQQVEAASDGVSPGDEVQRRADRRGGGDEPRLRAALAEPLGEHVAAERDADGVQRRGRPACAESAQHPVALLRVARVISTEQQVRFTRAAAKVNDRRAPSEVREVTHRRACVVAARVTFEAVEHRQQRRLGRRGLWLRDVDVDEVAIGRRPAFAAIGDFRQRHEPRRPDRLQVSARQPARRAIGRGHERHGGMATERRQAPSQCVSAKPCATRRSWPPRRRVPRTRGAAPSSIRPRS